MKKNILQTLLIVILIQNTYSQIGWQYMPITNDPTTYNSIKFINSNTGWAVGWVPGFAVGCRIAKSTNGGYTWNCQLDNPFPSLFDMYFINLSTGFAVGYTFLKTTNGGNTWSNIYNPAGDPQSVHFVNENTGFVVGVRPVMGGYISSLFKTTNGGVNWDTSSVSNCSRLNDINFINSNTGWICGNEGTLLKTNNASTFFQINIGYQNNLFSVFFINESTGWVGGQGLLLKTTNAGLNWINQVSGLGIIVKDIQFINPYTGWFTCDTSAGFKIYFTSNSGNSWSQEFLSAGSNAKIYFIDENTGWLAGGHSNFKTTNGGITGFSNISSEIPSSFSLSQNYPNPFNPLTKIKFDIPLSRGVDAVGGRGVSIKLSVYDILGREKTTLVNQQLKPGTYEADWDASNYPSGIYFYTLTAGDPSSGSGRGFKETKKMVLIK